MDFSRARFNQLRQVIVTEETSEGFTVTLGGEELLFYAAPLDSERILSYLAIFVCVYYCLAFCGMDTKTLLASAGIMSVVIGLGANKLIADILVGLAILFEGDFRVGDIVEIKGTRGMIKDIGIRTTKMMDKEGKLHIISNSELGTIVNCSAAGAVAIIDLWISRAVPPEKVEKLLAQYSPALMSRNPNVLGDSVLYGIETFSDMNVNIRIDTPCNGFARSSIKRYMRREWTRIFEENGIFRAPDTGMFIDLSSEEYRQAVYGRADVDIAGLPFDRKKEQP